MRSAQGVAHIWDRTAPIVAQALAGAVAGATPTTTTEEADRA